METLIIAILLVVVLIFGAVVIALLRRSPGAGATVEMRASVEHLRAVGELVVLKVFTQQIVTQSDHVMGEWGEKWLNWLVSSKKTAMIFEFVVDFRYDLKTPAFQAAVVGETGIRFEMPPCFYEIQLKDISIYDERASALVPLLLPEWLGQAFGGRFTEKEKNELIQAARQKAEEMALQLTKRMLGEVRQSAETTLSAIARNMGFDDIQFTFSEKSPVQGQIDLSKIEDEAQSALQQST